jgi:hypothetical protein
VPAAAVIPAPKAYTNIAAIKELVVGFLVRVPLARGGNPVCVGDLDHIARELWALFVGSSWGTRLFYFEKIRVFKAGKCPEYISMG